MTQHEIYLAAEAKARELGINFSHNLPHLWVDFAIQMVREHNEELEKKFDLGRVVSSTWIQTVIREAKP